MDGRKKFGFLGLMFLSLCLIVASCTKEPVLEPNGTEDGGILKSGEVEGVSDHDEIGTIIDGGEYEGSETDEEDTYTEEDGIGNSISGGRDEVEDEQEDEGDGGI